MSTQTRKNAVRPALAVSIGSSGRRFVDRSSHEKLRLEIDEFSVDLCLMLRTAGIWNCLPRAQKARIKRLPPVHVTTETPVSIPSDRQRRG